VFTDATLTAMAEVCPTTETQLLAISGVGRTKLDRYGADVLAICAGLEPAEDEITTGSVEIETAVKKTVAPDGDLL
jgi:DNA helicase-2/ATP-dependent DNA helicase PcrA